MSSPEQNIAVTSQNKADIITAFRQTDRQTVDKRASSIISDHGKGSGGDKQGGVMERN